MKRWMLSMFLAFVLAIYLVSASFNVDENATFIEQNYGEGDFVSGQVEANFSNQPNGEFSAEFGSINLNRNITLFDLLEEMDYARGEDYSCNPTSCENVFRVLDQGSASVSTLISGDEKKIYGFKITGENMEGITSFAFNITGDAGRACTNQLTVDFLNDGSWNYYNDKRTNTACPMLNPLDGCFSDDEWDAGNSVGNAVLSGTKYCEKIENLPASPGYSLVVNIKKRTPGAGDKLKLTIHDLGSGRLPYFCPKDEEGDVLGLDGLPIDEWRDIFCFVDYPSKVPFDAFICVEQTGSNGGEYEIKSETTLPCGGSGWPSSENSYLTRDFKISVQPMRYESVGNVRFDAEMYRKLNNDVELIPLINNYINETYDNNCSLGCVIPFSIWGHNQNIILSSANIRYNADGISLSSDKFYELGERGFTMSSEGVVLDIEKMGFEVPNVNGTHNFKLYFDGQKIAEEDIDVDIGFSFSISPRLALVGQNTRFTISSSEHNITSSVWDFGDGSAPINSADGSAFHIYRNASEYIAEVSAEWNGTASTKRFRIIAGNPEISANLTIEKYKLRIAKLRRDINSLPGWVKDKIKEKIGLDALNGQVEAISRKFDLLGSSATERRYVAIVNELLEINVPHSIKVLNSGTLPADVGFSYINVGHIASISNQANVSAEDTKNAIIAWIGENYDILVGFEVYSVIGDFESENILTKYSIGLTKKGGFSSGTNLIINYPLSSITFASSTYGQRNVGSGDATYIPIDGSGQPNELEFLIAGTNAPDVETLGVYISPPLSQLNIISINNPDIIQKERFNWTLFLVGMGIVLVLIFLLYIIIQSWYKRYYEKHLFKNPNDLYNLINFIYNSRKSGMRDGELRKKLIGKQWRKEQVTYVFNKIDGRRTGMWEIPLFKFLENRKVKKEIMKRQGRPIDARFIKRPRF